MLEVFIDTFIDSIKLLPFLFIAYLIMEYLEHKTSDKSKELIKKSGRFGPVLGAILGIFPQCGFGAMAANLYAGRIITMGTLIAIFLSTSDEMLPILISESVSLDIIIKILAIKLIIGIIAGAIIDAIASKLKKQVEENNEIANICKHGHCHCENGSVVKSALKHTVNIFIFISIVSLILNIVIHFVGEDNLSNLILNKPILGPIISSLIGLIPNCASSVIITKLYLSGVINMATMISGLLVNSGVGILVLFKVNKRIKENASIIVLLYTIGVIGGIILQFMGM